MPVPKTGHTTDKRIRGRRLQAIRAAHFARNPLCSGPDSQCERLGRIRQWSQLDHRIALTNQGTDTDDNRQGLCDDCHKAKTDRDLGHRHRPEIGADGYPVDIAA